jgi:23S rRNA U2552 (ribose-2'-O)-methylase RlmE/FtsJ
MAFRHVKVAKPDASRKESWERFIVARNRKA